MDAIFTVLQNAHLLSLHFPLLILISQHISRNIHEAQFFLRVWSAALKPLMACHLQIESLHCSFDSMGLKIKVHSCPPGRAAAVKPWRLGNITLQVFDKWRGEN